MSWSVSKSTGNNWVFHFLSDNYDVDLVFVDGGFRVDEGDLALYSVGPGRWNRSSITVDGDYVDIESAGEGGCPTVRVLLPEASAEALRSYIEAIVPHQPRIGESYDFDHFEGNNNNREHVDHNQLTEANFDDAVANANNNLNEIPSGGRRRSTRRRGSRTRRGNRKSRRSRSRRHRR